MVLMVELMNTSTILREAAIIKKASAASKEQYDCVGNSDLSSGQKHIPRDDICDRSLMRLKIFNHYFPTFYMQHMCVFKTMLSGTLDVYEPRPNHIFNFFWRALYSILTRPLGWDLFL